MARAVHERFPDISIEGVVDNPPPFRAALAQAVQILQFTLLAIVFFGDSILPKIGFNPAPEIYESMKQNKMMSFALIWFIGNTLASNLVATGAFEVELNGHEIWSKVKTGQLPPHLEYLYEAIDKVRADL